MTAPIFTPGGEGPDPKLFLDSHVIKLVEVAKKYEGPKDVGIRRTPEYTLPGGPNTYHCSNNAKAWTQGFFPGLLWLLIERERLVPGTLAKACPEGNTEYTEQEVMRLARRYQAGFEGMKRPAGDHDQGFRFGISFGRDYALTGDEHARDVMLEASESLLDRYHPIAGCIRSWDALPLADDKTTYSRDNMDEHYLVIIDNMMNLDMLYEATALTGDHRYATVATHQAEKSSEGHVRRDGTTYHVVNFCQKTGKALKCMTAQGWSDESCWARGPAWGIYGYAQCALRTGREDFRDIARRLADVFLARLGSSGVPAWDFDAPTPAPYDASSGAITARGLQMLYQLYLPSDPGLAERFLERANKLARDLLRECLAPEAVIRDGAVDWGEGGWEPILMHSSMVGNPRATRQQLDHGLVYADYYMMEFGNEAIKIDRARKARG